MTFELSFMDLYNIVGLSFIVGFCIATVLTVRSYEKWIKKQRERLG